MSSTALRSWISATQFTLQNYGERAQANSKPRARTRNRLASLALCHRALERGEIPVPARRRLDQRACVGMLRIAEDPRNLAVLDHLAALHDRDRVADLRGDAKI